MGGSKRVRFTWTPGWRAMRSSSRMVRAKRRRRKLIDKAQPTPQLTDADIDHYFAAAAATVKEVELQLQHMMKLPASSLLLRIQTRR